MEANTLIDRKKLTATVIVRVGLLFLILALIFFITAGSLRYWEAWLYLAVLFVMVSVVMAYFLKKDPKLIERRMRMKEKEREQKAIIKVGFVLSAISFLLPGLDGRYAWSSVPTAVVIIADGMIVLGYALFVRVLRENRYASRTIEVEQGQRVVTTGPYAVVRHPMYVAALTIYLFSPIALGSYWGLIPSVLFIPLLVVRILDEERVLRKDLKGYVQYIGMTKYRLVPGLW